MNTKERRLGQGQRHNETETVPPVAIVVHGLDHSAFNIQSATTFAVQFEDQLMSAQGKTVLFLEQAGVTIEQANAFKVNISSFGFDGALVREVLYGESLGSRPSGSDVRQRKKQIEEAGSVDKILEQKLLPADQIWTYYLYRELERIRRRKSFSVAIETHAYTDIVKEKAVHDAARAKERLADRNWHNGNFDDALIAYDSAVSLTNVASLMRDDDVVRQSQKIVSTLMKEKSGGLLYKAFGLAHIPRLRQVKDTAKNTDIRTILIRLQAFEGNLDVVIADLISDGKKVPLELLAKHLLARNILNSAIYGYIQNGNVNYFAWNYELFSEATLKHVSLLSFEEIRKICEERALPAFQFVEDGEGMRIINV